MIRSLASIALATGTIAALVACSPQINTEFRISITDGNEPLADAIVAPEAMGAYDVTDWVQTDNRGDATAWGRTTSDGLGPHRVVFAYAEEIGLSVLIEGQDFDWRRIGNNSGREWMADFDASMDPVDEPGVRSCGTDGTITYEADELLPETTWMSVGTNEADGVQGLDCSFEDNAITCLCPETITDRAFLVSRHVGDSIDDIPHSGRITVDVIVELQLAE